MKKTVLLFLLSCLFFNVIHAQASKAVYAFSPDSLAGFDEKSVQEMAIANHYFGVEYDYVMSKAKRDFTKRKYFVPIRAAKASAVIVPGYLCDNIDFELCTLQTNAPTAVQGWSVESCNSYGGCVRATYTIASSDYTVFTAPTIDPITGLTISSYFSSSSTVSPAGSSFIKLNNDFAGAGETKLTKAFMVNVTDTVFQFAILPVLEDGGHPCCDQSGYSVKITVTNTLNNTVEVFACPNFTVFTPGMSCQDQPISSFLKPALLAPGWSYLPWNPYSINLSAYVNDLVEFEITVWDCNASGHAGYIYFDARCGSGSVIPSQNWPTFQNAVASITACASPTSIAVPFLLFQMSGPGSFTTTNTGFITSTPGIYTFTTIPGMDCSAYSRTLTLLFSTPSTSISYAANPVCEGEILTLTVSGVSNFQWNSGQTTNTLQLTASPPSIWLWAMSTNSSGCTGYSQLTFYTNLCTAIIDFPDRAKYERLYPNPGNSIFSIDHTGNGLELVINNAFGQAVFKQSIAPGRNRIEPNLPPGIYYYATQQNGRIASGGKLIVE